MNSPNRDLRVFKILTHQELLLPVKGLNFLQPELDEYHPRKTHENKI
jgi:hypothetical protein